MEDCTGVEGINMRVEKIFQARRVEEVVELVIEGGRKEKDKEIGQNDTKE